MADKPTPTEIKQAVAKRLEFFSNGNVTAQECLDSPGILIGPSTTGNDAQRGAGLLDDARERLRISLNKWLITQSAQHRIPVGSLTAKTTVGDTNKLVANCFKP